MIKKVIESPLLSAPEAAQYLHVHQNTMYRMIKKGEFPVVQIGDRYYIKKSDLESYIEKVSKR